MEMHLISITDYVVTVVHIWVKVDVHLYQWQYTWCVFYTLLTVVGIWVKVDGDPDPVLLSAERREHRGVGDRAGLRLRQPCSTLKGEGQAAGGQVDHGVLSPAVEGVLPPVQRDDVRVAPRPGCRDR